jgi:hypothetical protein
VRTGYALFFVITQKFLVEGGYDFWLGANST